MKLDNFKKIITSTPLASRLQVANEMCFISLLSELGFREDKIWTDEENALLGKLCNAAKKHTENIISVVKGWEKDGSPS